MATLNFNVKNGLTVGNVTINATSGLANLVSINVSQLSNLGPVGNVTITGGSSGQYLQTNGSGVLSWATIPSGDGIANGTSNILIPTINGNVNTSVAGNANVFVVTGTGVNTNGTLNATGNANVLNLGTAQVLATANVTAPQLISNIATGTAPLVVTSTTVVANLNANALQGSAPATANTASTIALRDASGNLSANFFIGNGSQLTGLNTDRISNGTSNVSIPTVNGNVNLVSAGNTTMVVTGTGANITGTANISGNANALNIGVGTGIFTTAANTPLVQNGNSNITIVANGNISLSATGTPDEVVITATGMNVNGTSNVTGVASFGANANVAGNVNITANANVGTNLHVTGAAFVGANANVTGNVNVTANVSANNGSIGNLLTVGANANVTGNVNVTANANVGTNLHVTGSAFVGGIANVDGNIRSNANVITDNILGRTGAITITSAGTNTNINLKPNGLGNIDANAAYITSVKNPINLQDAATKAYVDTLVSTGISIHPSVNAATTTTLAVATGGTTAYNSPNGAANGIGAYISTTGTFNLIDTANVQTVGARILVKNEANSAWNGVYTYANTTAIIRSIDTDTYAAADPDALGQNDYFFVLGGSTNINTSWICSTIGTITFGTTNIVFSQFSATQAYTAGTGLTLSPSLVFSVNASQTQVTQVGTLLGLNVNGTVTANTFVSNVATGTAPLTVSSNTVVANLNADLLDGFNTATAATANTVAVRDTNGNLSANFFIGNGSQLTGLPSGTSIVNGTSNVSIPTTNGNVNIVSAGNTTMVVTGTGANIAGTLNATGNAVVANLSATGTVFANNHTASGAATGNANVVGTVTGNLGIRAISATYTDNSATGSTTIANAAIHGLGTPTLAAANTSVTATNAATFFIESAPTAGTNMTITNGYALFVESGNSFFGGSIIGTLANGTSNVSMPTANGNINLTAAGNTTLVVTGTGANVTGTLGVSGNANVLNLGTAQVLATANVTAPQVIANIAQGTAPFLVNSNTVVANLNASLLLGATSATANTASTIALRDASGNLAANFFIGNGSQLTGLPSGTSIVNGTSNVSIPTTNGNVNIVSAGNTTMVVTGTGANITGTANVSGNANVLNIGATNGVFTANVTAGNANVTGQLISTLASGTAPLVVTSTTRVANLNAATAGVANTVNDAAQPNITSVGTLTSLVVSGNVTAGNVRLNGGLTSNRANVAITAANVIIDEFPAGTYRTAKYIISASGDFGFQSIETLLVHDTTDAYITIYGSVSSNVSSEIINLSANYNGVSGNVRVYASNIGPNVKVNLVSSYIQT